MHGKSRDHGDFFRGRGCWLEEKFSNWQQKKKHYNGKEDVSENDEDDTCVDLKKLKQI